MYLAISFQSNLIEMHLQLLGKLYCLPDFMIDELDIQVANIPPLAEMIV